MIKDDVFCNISNCNSESKCLPIPGAARSKEWVCGGSLAGIAVSNPSRCHGCLSLVSADCCQAEVTAVGRSHIPTACVCVCVCH